ncbi:hypothetical protein R1flu_024557 [Riccia fluitans]|uniref:Uncharacterized protein n=1 Tax=Riccia fluitans TaxID=41844 RepID=A0ABD1XVN8_9MARC
MDGGSGSLKITKLLLSLVLASVIHTTTAATPVPSLSSNSISTRDASTYANYVQATPAQLGKYDIVWVDLNSQKAKGKCYPTGYYDNTFLTTPTSVQLCLSNLRSTIVNDYALGGFYFTDTFYYLDGDQSCVGSCLEQALTLPSLLSH